MKVFVLRHPQSANLLTKMVFAPKGVTKYEISCGTTSVPNANLSEANDFFPTYASWNSVLFETSVILTIWEHADELIGNDPVAILHSDIRPHFTPAKIWKQVRKWVDAGSPVGLTAPSACSHAWHDWLIPADAKFIPKRDPMALHDFEFGIDVWDHIKEYDLDHFQWAMDTQPNLIYSHQFACSRQLFDILGNKLYEVARKLRLRDTGFWTPHMFERLIAIYLARYGEASPILSTCFWHVSSSGSLGPGQLTLYGPRPRRFYRIRTRWNDGKASLSPASN